MHQQLLTSSAIIWASQVALVVKNPPARFDPWVRKIAWRRKRQPTSVFLPGKSLGQRSLLGYGPQGRKRVGHRLTQNSNNKADQLSGSQLRKLLQLKSKNECLKTVLDFTDTSKENSLYERIYIVYKKQMVCFGYMFISK